MAARCPTWREPEAILALAELAVAEREGVRRDDIARAARRAAGRAGRVALLRHAAHRHLVVADPPPRRRRAGRSATSCPTRSPPTSQRDGLYATRRCSRVSSLARPGAPSRPRRLAAIAGYAADKKAIDIVELDLRGVLGYTDYFVICSGNTDRQTKAIHDGIHQGLKKEHGLLPRRVEGLSEARWILMDYLDVSCTSSRRRRATSTASSSSGARPRGAPSDERLERTRGRPSRRPRESGASRARTRDLVTASHALSQLSYSPKRSVSSARASVIAVVAGCVRRSGRAAEDDRRTRHGTSTSVDRQPEARAVSSCAVGRDARRSRRACTSCARSRVAASVVAAVDARTPCRVGGDGSRHLRAGPTCTGRGSTSDATRWSKPRPVVAAAPPPPGRSTTIPSFDRPPLRSRPRRSLPSAWSGQTFDYEHCSCAATEIRRVHGAR